MKSKVKLYKHQQALVDLNPQKHLLAWETGTGKSLTALTLAEKNGKDILVICPKSIKDQWQEIINNRESIITVMTKEEFKKNVSKLKKFDTLIIDEAHYFSGQKSQLSAALRGYIKYWKIENIYLLTATPYLSTPWNIYVLADILGKQWHYWKFKQKFFADVNMGGRLIPVIRRGIEPEIANLVAMLGSTVRMSDCVDVPEQIFQQEYFNLTKEQIDAIKALEDVNYISRWTKIHQICGGSLKGDGYVEDQFYKSEKFNRLIDLCKEHKKLIIVCRYNNEVKIIADKLKQLEFDVITITGETKDKNEVVKDADQKEDCVVIVNAACSEGYELPSFPIMIFYSYDFSLKNYVQMIGRIQRINHIKKNVYLSLIVKDTIDEDVYKCIQSKKDFDIAIYNKK